MKTPTFWSEGSPIATMLPFALTIFISAFLLFQVQPVIARFILPWYGGSPAVWTTCMLFFQAALLLGYCYSDAVVRWFSLRQQILIHAVLLWASLLLLPIIPDPALRGEEGMDPARSILWLLLLTIGGNYCLLATTGPLLQSWFAKSFSGISPYRLFALSNFGSLLALLGYPLLVETTLPVRMQALVWSWGYGGFVLVATWAALATWRRNAGLPAAGGDVAGAPQRAPLPPLSLRRTAAWLLLSTLPSVLLLTITNEVSQEVAVVPLLWVVPLSLYLISFIICFESSNWYRRDVYGVLMVVATFLAAVCQCQPTAFDYVTQFTIYCLLLFSCCMTLHGELAALKPDPSRLTTYYVVISVGGALGGVLVVLVAPLCFTGFYELQLSIAAAVLVTFVRWWMARDGGTLTRVMMVVSVVSSTAFILGFIRYRLTINEDTLLRLGVVTSIWFIAFSLLGWQHLTRTFLPRGHREGQSPRRGDGLLWLLTLSLVFVFSWLLLSLPLWMREAGALLGLALVLWIWFVGIYTHDRPIVSGPTYVKLSLVFVVFLAQVLVISVGVQISRRNGKVIDVHRNFFGISGVEEVESPLDGRFREIFNGRIGHGRQYLREDLRRQVNLYYGPRSGVGLALNRHPRREAGLPLKVGVIGLGTGTLAAWGRPGDQFIYYEINPAVIDLAERHFTYLDESQADCEVQLGDARILMERTLQEQGSLKFDVLVMDAFSSDSIPRHLLTEEAMQVYEAHMAPGGIMAFHISNWFLELRPVVFGLADQIGWQAANVFTNYPEGGRYHSSNWMLVTQSTTFLQDQQVQQEIDPYFDSRRVLWTDDFGSVLQVLKVDRPEFWPEMLWPLPVWSRSERDPESR